MPAMKACFLTMVSVTEPWRVLWLALLMCCAVPQAAAEEYLSQPDFLTLAFGTATPEVKTLWLQGDIKQAASEILGHPYKGLRIRYWQLEQKRAWIMEEIGKERPIRIGVITNGDRINDVHILAFEESRGWEVRNRFFTEQFVGAGLDPQRQLDRHIDGITGATLSVRAVSNTARLVLYLLKSGA